ncbi:MAG: hypothetical protein DIZ77_08075 [endosymbiont of Seepiophila jonesi]|uniref:IraD/Gp25-like domain-containing protein n=1 Tax=endosymbiont of Lamellibrachia luymesi TaxID=2200907 RepID=A0A370DZ85_9GAMM|nr:MAG: hypothetical protein DIZ79_05100 [endosymbiont of Lamellibrachia luymesi]RDH92593.1 MAG: hypothetical protein DIZ77_08075 [endosymbiont of Seepiophila jonesi]RLJ18003.1 MAG: hypothetical protein DJ031_11860 [bacterium endosymbiont of Escarpia laminata]
MDDDRDFLGRGWGFPPTFGEGGKTLHMLSDEADIESSLEVLLSTRPGERLLRPDFGCNLDRMLFEPLDTGLKTFMTDLIATAILYHEPRIDVERISLAGSDDNEGLVLIEIEFRVRATNARRNMVYPFYKQEGTDLR